MASMPTDREIERGRRRLERMWRAGTAFLGSDLALMGGAMTWVSEHRLVAALSNAGGFGVIACGAMQPDQLSAEIAATEGLTGRPFGVNLIIMHPKLGELIDVCGAHRVSHIVLAGGLPDRATIARVKDGGARLLCFAPSLAVARRLVRTGAGGCQMGTRFVCATESIAHPRFKEAFVRASARDAVPSVQIDPEFKVIPVRALANQATRAFAETQVDLIARYRRDELSYEEAALAIEHFWAGALRRAVIEGDVEHGSLMAGQSVGLVRRIQPTAAIVAELVEQTAAALA